MQELHDLTGLKIEEAYCAVGGSGNVCFSLLPDGFSERCFYSANLPAAYGGAGIPSFTLAWQELGNAWSPLKFSELKDLEGLQPRSRLNRENVLLWYYERLHMFHAGESAYANWEDLWLTNGDRYAGELQETEYGPALVNLYGPYPEGEIHR